MKKEVSVSMANSTEATPIAHLVQLCNQFSSDIYFENDSMRVNAKSIMGMMSVVLTQGSKITIDVVGEDEDAAVAAIEDFLSK